MTIPSTLTNGKKVIFLETNHRTWSLLWESLPLNCKLFVKTHKYDWFLKSIQSVTNKMQLIQFRLLRIKNEFEEEWHFLGNWPMNFPSFLPMDFKTIMFVLKNLNDSTCPLTKRVKKQSLSYIDRLWKMLKKKIKSFFLIFKDCYHSRRVKQNSKTRLKKSYILMGHHIS